MTRQDLIATLPKGLVCAELGVFAGDFSRDILRIMEPRRLFLVDKFEGMATSGDQNGENLRRLYMPTEEMLLREEFKSNPVVKVVRNESVQWLRSLPPGSLDFVYIDTTHSYEQTSAELSAAKRAVKRGGWIAGHDYSHQFPGVIRAVCELGLPMKLSEDGLPSFLMQNPEKL